MCQQTKILDKIKQKGAVNGYSIELAEAQAADYVSMDKKVMKIEKDISLIKKEQKKQGNMLAELSGQIKLIVVRLNSPIETDRKDAIFWQQIKGMLSTTMGKIFILLAFGCIGLAGQRILELLGLIK